MPRLYALADLHIGHPVNRQALAALRPGPSGSGLILAGDLGESSEHLSAVFERAKACYDHVFWVPGNHELYTVSGADNATDQPPADRARGEAKYDQFVALARQHQIHTPEDPWVVWDFTDVDNSSSSAGHEPATTGSPSKAVIALLFTLYDYSFRPDHVTREGALEWAAEQDIQATDEFLLHPDPYETRDAWCHKLCERFEGRLREAAQRHPDVPFVLVNHWPLRQDLVYIPLVPRFSLWCGTKRTEDWHQHGRFGSTYAGAKVVVTGHLHVRRTDYKQGTRFEEVSLGYPRQWEKARNQNLDINDMLREILPGPKNTHWEHGPTMRTYG